MKKRVKVNIPRQLDMLCSLLGIAPEQLIQTFVYNVSMDIKSSGKKHRRAAQEYFLSMDYGRDQYTVPQLESMFDDLLHLMGEQLKENTSRRKQKKCSFLNEWYARWEYNRDTN